MENIQKRQKELDYAKTLAIFFMVIIHVFEELSCYGIDESLPTGFLENFIQFGAGPLAAPLFIFAMGVGMVFSRNQEPEKLFRRGIKLLLLGLMLNIARDVIPRLLVWLISGTSQGWEVYRYQLFNIDILHFAGLAFMLTALFKKLNVSTLALVPVAVAMQAFGNWLSLVTEPTGFWEILLSYFYYIGDLSCFSLLLWYLSMVIGMVVGLLMKSETDDTDTMYRRLLLGSACALFGFLFACYINNIDLRVFYALYENFYYRQTFFNFLFNTLVILMLLGTIHFVIKKLTKGYAFFRYCGDNLTKIYIVQWMIIGWMSSFQDYLNIEPDFGGSVGLGILIALISIGISRFLPNLKW